jgi:Tol biopolymer transport system component
VADAVTIETAEVRVPIAAASAAVMPQANATPLQGRTPVSLRQLVASVAPGTDAFSPSFAPHGQAVLFHSGRTGSALMRATFDTAGKPAVATVLRDGASNYHATVSPDGMWLAYDSDRDGSRAVYVAHSDATGPRKISGDGYAAVPRWSPDGRRLAFLKAEHARPRVWNVWVADVATGSLSRVSHHNVGQAWGASWFPDGHRIAYSVEDRLILTNLHDGSTKVVRSPRRGHLIRTPAVSPDGRYVVFQVQRDGVWLFDVAGGAMRRLLTDAAAEEFAWAPDGRAVAFHTRRNGAWSVWQLQLDPTLVAG